MTIKAGISTACLYPEYTEKALDKVCRLSVDEVEIFINTHSELEKDFIYSLKRILDDTNTRCKSLHPFTCSIEPMMLFTSYERRITDALEYYKKYFEAMNILGAEIFVLHGNKPQNVFPDESYFENYERLYDTGREFGITVTHENVARCTAGDLDFLVKLKNALGDKARFTLDVKQAVRKGYSPYEFVKKLGKSIAHIHLSDFNDDTVCGLVGCGKLDFEKFCKELKNAGFDGSMILELYNWGFKNMEELGENYNYIKKVIENTIYI